MPDSWTLADLVAEAATRLAALPPPKNGQVRAVPDDRTIRYYAAIGLLDKPAAMRGRTALYGPRHLAQVVAIKRMQAAGKSLTEIRDVWPSLLADDTSLARMSGVPLPAPVPTKPRAGRKDFWKRDVEAQPELKPQPEPQPKPELKPEPQPKPELKPEPEPQPKLKRQPEPELKQQPEPEPKRQPQPEPSVEVRIELAPGAYLSVAVGDGTPLTSADVRALRAAAGPLVTELANRGLLAHVLGTLEEKP